MNLSCSLCYLPGFNYEWSLYTHSSTVPLVFVKICFRAGKYSLGNFLYVIMATDTSTLGKSRVYTVYR